MFEDGHGDLWPSRLALADVAKLRLAGCLDLNELARTGELSDWLSDLGPVIRAAWILAGRPTRLTDWIDRMDGEAVQRMQVAVAKGILDFFPERSREGESEKSSSEPDRSGQWIERLGWELAGLTGLDGSCTLRELAWAARERQRFSGELAAWHLAEIVCRIPFGDPKRLDVAAINPYRAKPKPKSEKLIALEEWQAKQLARARAGLPVELMPKESIGGNVQGPAES